MTLSIDHIVITVKNINKSINFYSNILGMELREFHSSFDNTKRKSLHFGNQKINLHEVLKPFQPHAKNPLPGTVDICFISNAYKNSLIYIDINHVFFLCWFFTYKKVCKKNMEKSPYFDYLCPYS